MRRSAASCGRRSRPWPASRRPPCAASSWRATGRRSVPAPTSTGCGPPARSTSRATSRTRWAWPTCSRPSTRARSRSSRGCTALHSAAGWACVPLRTSSSRRAARASGSRRRVSGSCRRSSRHSSSRRSARATPARCSPAAAGSMRSGPSGSASSTRSSKGEEALDRAVDVAVADLLMAGPTAARAAKAIVREVRGLGHGSAKWHTARVIARQRVTEEAREGFAAFDEKRRPSWAPEADSRLTHAGLARVRSEKVRQSRQMPEELAPSEVAKRLGTSTRTVQRWIERGVLPARRVGGRWRVAFDAFDASAGTRSGPEASPIREPVHRESRRDRAAHRAHLRSARDPSGRARHGRPGRPRPARRRRGRGRGARQRRRRGPSGLRVPCRERGLRRAGRSGGPASGSDRRPPRSGRWATRPPPDGWRPRSTSRSSRATTAPTRPTPR